MQKSSAIAACPTQEHLGEALTSFAVTAGVSVAAVETVTAHLPPAPERGKANSSTQSFTECTRSFTEKGKWRFAQGALADVRDRGAKRQ